MILTLSIIEYKCFICFHDKTLAKIEGKRLLAECNIQLAMGLEKEQVKVYSERNGIVVIV